MLIYILIFSAIIFILGVVGFIGFLRDEGADDGATLFFGVIAILSGIATGFSIALLANS
jgi:hypothetical protein